MNYARVLAQDAKVQAKLKNGKIDVIKADLEATVQVEKWYEPSPYECGVGHTEYGFTVEVEDLDQEYTESDYDIQEVVKIIDADWEILDEWRDELCE